MQGEVSEVALPADLIALGFVIVRYDRGMAAVSPAHGCTGVKVTLERLIDEARDIAQFCKYINTKKAEESHDHD